MSLRSLLVLLALSTCSLAAHADGIGSPVTGGLFFDNGGTTYGTTNYFNPANGFVPVGYDNNAGTTVTIGSGNEFGFYDGANLDTASFTGSTLKISDIEGPYGSSPFEMTFTSPAFASISQLTNVSGYTYAFTGQTLQVFFSGLSDPGTYTTTFSYQPSAAVTPEPSSLILLGTGALGLLGAARRRFSRSV